MQLSSYRMHSGNIGLFDHIHTSKGVPLSLHDSTAKLIADNLNYNIRLHKRGLSFYADIDRIYHLMVEKLKAEINQRNRA